MLNIAISIIKNIKFDFKKMIVEKIKKGGNNFRLKVR